MEEIIKLDPKDEILSEIVDMMEELVDRKRIMKINNEEDEFLNAIIDCIRESHCKDLILEKRVKDIEYNKKNFNVEYKIDDYEILMHRDVKKDWSHLKKSQIKEVNEKIRKTPKHPFNDSEKDSEKLKKLEGWYSQRIGDKDRLVYKKVSKEKRVYIATVCDHYKDAEGRTRKLLAYR